MDKAPLIIQQWLTINFHPCKSVVIECTCVCTHMHTVTHTHARTHTHRVYVQQAHAYLYTFNFILYNIVLAACSSAHSFITISCRLQRTVDYCKSAETSHTLISRSWPTVSSCLRVSSRSMNTMLCFASWNVAIEVWLKQNNPRTFHLSTLPFTNLHVRTRSNRGTPFYKI